MDRSLSVLLALTLVLGSASAQQQRTRFSDQRSPVDRSTHSLLISGYTSSAVHLYNPYTGAVKGTFGTEVVAGAQDIGRGPDGLLYVCSEESGRVLRYMDDGTFVDAFIADDPKTPADETGGLAKPTGAAFDPAGDLYVGDYDGDCVKRYDGTTGAYLGDFVAAGSGGLNGPDVGIVFGPDGNLYVPSFLSNAVLRYSSTDGSFIDVFAALGMSRPRNLVFHADGMLYVSSWANNRIMRYDGTTGALVDIFTTANLPTGFGFSPFDGDLYVTSDNSNKTWRFDGTTGAFKEIFLDGGAGGVSGATFLFWLPEELEGPKR